MIRRLLLTVALAAALCPAVNAQKYRYIDKTVAVVGNEPITLSLIEGEAKNQRARGMASDRSVRCELLETILESKLLLMQARIDSLSVNSDWVEGRLSQDLDQAMSYFGGEKEVEEFYGKPMYRIRNDLRRQYEEMSLTEQERQEIMNTVPALTPFEVKAYMDTVDRESLPMVPAKYKLSQICLYPDREAAALAAREKLLELRERIIAGEKFSLLARMYSDDTESARRGGELGMLSRSLLWPAFSDAAMALRPGTISQIVETPDGFHIIEVLEKKGDMFNARHILLMPKYTAADQEKAFARLDSLRSEILSGAVSFEMAASFYSEDAPSRTNGGQMADPNTGSAYFEVDQLKPSDYAAIRNLQEGEISAPVVSSDNDGRADPSKGYVNGKLMYKIIRLDKIIPAHTASFESDFNELQELVLSQQQVKAVDAFLEKKIAETRIVIDPIFEDCDFRRAVWATKIKKQD